MTPADPSWYLRGDRGSRVVVIPQPIATWLFFQCHIHDVRPPDGDEELAAALVAMQMAALEEASAPGSSGSAARTELGGQLNVKHVNTRTAAEQLHISTRAVTLAITDRRLNATKVDGRWQVDPDDLNRYRR